MKIRPAASGSGFRVLFQIRTAASGSSFRVLLKRGQGIIHCMVQDSGYYSKHDLQRLVQDSAYYSKYELQRLEHYSGYYSKMVRILFSLLFSIQGIIENTTCRVWFRINVLFKIRIAASGSSFRVLLKRGQGIIQRLVHYSGYYSKHDLQRLVQDSAYYSKYELQRIIQNTSCSVWFIIQGIIKKWSGYFSATGSGFSVLFKIRAAASGTLFRVLYKNGQNIIQRMVQYSGYY